MSDNCHDCPNCADMRARLKAAEATIERLRARKKPGRLPSNAKDEKSRLVRKACEAQDLSREQLAEVLGVDSARLSPSHKFADVDKERLMAHLRTLAGVKPKKTKVVGAPPA